MTFLIFLGFIAWIVVQQFLLIRYSSENNRLRKEVRRLREENLDMWQRLHPQFRDHIDLEGM